MTRIFKYIGWQTFLLAKYQILTVAVAIAFIYVILLASLSFLQTDIVTVLFIFLDPTALGFIFIGVMILFEKGDNTLDAQIVTPMRTSDYIWSKALALLIPAVICSTAIAISTQGFNFYPLPFYASVILSSLIFTFIGIAGVIRVKTFNQYMVIIPIFMAPTSLPLLNYLGLTHWKIFALIPTQSTLNLLADSLTMKMDWSQIFDISYLGIWTYLSYIFARKQFEKKIYK